MTASHSRAGLFTAMLASLALLFGAPPPEAQATALTIEDLHQESVTQKCQNSGCEWKFTPVPAGKYLAVTHVSCRFIFEPTGGAYTLTEARIGVRQGALLLDRYDILTPALLSNSGTKRIWVLSNQTSHLVNASERPVILISLTGNAFFRVQDTTQRCTIGGVLRDL